MCGGNICPFPAQLVTHNRCVVALNGHLMLRNGPTIGVWWKLMSISGQIVTYKRFVVVINGPIMRRNLPTIGVWWKYMSISCQISHSQ